MALTNAQKFQVRFYLGWSARFHQTDSRLEQALSATDNDADAQAEVIVLLASLTDIDTKLVDAHKRMKAAKLGSIELSGPSEIGMLRSEGRRFAGRMGAMMGVAVRHDVFSGMGTKHFAGYNGLYKDGGGSGGGNLPPLG